MALLKILVAGWLLPSRGDGPLETSSSTSTTPDPASISDASVCNPYRGYSYISIGAAGGIGSSQCTASWDLYEVEVRTSNGQVSALTAWSPTGSDSGHPPSEAVDGDLNSFWAGDHDLGMSCSCWDDSKKDGQLVSINLGGAQNITSVTIHQGGSGDQWAVKRMRLHCHDQVGYSSATVPPLELDVSMVGGC
ncbi:ACP5 [Symbiodinium natans]|uniref:ACP5 protein n=1 Tax=Symbiodinium natans TaxID=878477 RepID=A0A812QRK3_9DINO|nr:ACP5 [Symbiodinium natans]